MGSAGVRTRWPQKCGCRLTMGVRQQAVCRNVLVRACYCKPGRSLTRFAGCYTCRLPLQSALQGGISGSIALVTQSQGQKAGRLRRSKACNRCLQKVLLTLALWTDAGRCSDNISTCALPPFCTRSAAVLHSATAGVKQQAQQPCLKRMTE